MEDKLIYGMAREMTGCPVLPPDLKARIDRVVELVEKVNGELGTLRSSQVLAHIIFEWELQL